MAKLLSSKPNPQLNEHINMLCTFFKNSVYQFNRRYADTKPKPPPLPKKQTQKTIHLRQTKFVFNYNSVLHIDLYPSKHI